MTNSQSHVRPGGSAYVSPEGIIHGTDEKYRWAYETASLPILPRRCLLFTLDENRVSRCLVKGRATVDEVTHAFAVWVGGQSQPALRFEPPKVLELSTVRRITVDRTRGLIRLNRFVLLASPQQLDPILDLLRQNCPQAAIQ